MDDYKHKKSMKPILLLLWIPILILSGCAESTEPAQNTYGVFLSSEYEQLPDDLHCETLVIDAQYYTAEEIARLHEDNEKIYSYINIGAIEDFREYYSEYTDLFLGDYENWPEEKYVDVSQEAWQKFILETLTPQLQEKGIDGLFLDNLDVYYEYPTEEIYSGITVILEGLNDTGLSLMVNGADVYVTEYMDRTGNLSGLIDAVNQETVFTKIQWENETFEEATDEDTKYYLEYLSRVQEAGVDVYLLEYTKDNALADDIRKQCDTMGYKLYVSDSIELDGES